LWGRIEEEKPNRTFYSGEFPRATISKRRVIGVFEEKVEEEVSEE